GLPIVEARHFGKPVIASDIPVFREVTEGARDVRFFEAGSATGLADVIRDFVVSHQNPGAAATASEPWASWADSASQLHEVV
ncbi:hypothetical protein, partial [Klebsiella variicola]|uniref:hypothetical protein n=1 Tax=Klebsiella variicola TaxID=244366 RepID=UPI0019538F54